MRKFLRLRTFTFISITLVLLFFGYNLHFRPFTFITIPRVFAQINTTIVPCPATFSVMASFSYRATNGNIVTFGCFDNRSGNVAINGTVYVVPPQGTADIGSQIMAAINAAPLIQEQFESSSTANININIGFTGTYDQTTQVQIFSKHINVNGPGRNNLKIRCHLAGDCFQITDTVFGSYSNGASLTGMTITANCAAAGSSIVTLCSGIGNNSVGIHAGDMWGLKLRDLNVYNFNGTSGVGIWFDDGFLGGNGCVIGNHCGFIENGYYSDINIGGNTFGWRFSNFSNGNVGFSYGYNTWDRIWFQCDTNQTCVQIDGNTSANITPTIYHSRITWTFEPWSASTGTFTALTMAQFAMMSDNTYNIFAEPTYGGVGIAFNFNNSSVVTGFGSWLIFCQNAGCTMGSSTTTAIFNIQGSVSFTNTPTCVFNGVAGPETLTATMSAGWGTTANIAACSGYLSSGVWLRIFATGTGQAANPTITFTFNTTGHTVNPQVTWRNAPVCTLTLVGASNIPATVPVITNGDPPNTTTTSAVFTIGAFTPVAAAAYDFVLNCQNKQTSQSENK